MAAGFLEKFVTLRNIYFIYCNVLIRIINKKQFNLYKKINKVAVVKILFKQNYRNTLSALNHRLYCEDIVFYCC